MKPRSLVRVLGFSGPDGSGKSTLLRAVADAAVTRGALVESTYLYGCIACRRLPVPSRLRSTLSSPGTVALETAAPPRRARPSVLQRLHAVVDAVEVDLRLHLACRRSSRIAHRTGRYVVLLTDRTPIDSLVKHEPSGDGWVARRLSAVCDRYVAIALLDARSDVMSVRDGEHGSSGLEQARISYRRWSERTSRVHRVCTEAAPPDRLAGVLLDQALQLRVGSLPTSGRPPGTPEPSR